MAERSIFMPVNLRGRSGSKLLNYTPAESRHLLDLAENFKNLKRMDTPLCYPKGKSSVLLFEQASTHTHCPFDVTGMEPGMGVTHLGLSSSQMGREMVLCRHGKGAGADVRW